MAAKWFPIPALDQECACIYQAGSTVFWLLEESLSPRSRLDRVYRFGIATWRTELRIKPRQSKWRRDMRVFKAPCSDSQYQALDFSSIWVCNSCPLLSLGSSWVFSLIAQRILTTTLPLSWLKEKKFKFLKKFKFRPSLCVGKTASVGYSKD